MCSASCWVLLFMLAIASTVNGQSPGEGPGHGKAVVCYVASWAVYRTPPGDFQLDDLEPELCTHLVYAFAGLNETDYTIISRDPWQDLPDGGGKAGYQRLVSLKDRYSHLKVTIAIESWNEGSLKYSLMADSSEHRGRFVDSVVNFLRRHGFDGLSLDWKYPALRDGRPVDKTNFVLLVKELKEAFMPNGYILTAALGVKENIIDTSYDLPELGKYLDLIVMLSYNYHGSWQNVLGANAPLSYDPQNLTVEYSINLMLQRNVSASKLVLSLSTTGWIFLLSDPVPAEVEFGRTPTLIHSFPDPLFKEPAVLLYFEICKELSKQSSKWSYHWDEKTNTPYIRDGNRFVSYDNERSMALKVKMAMDYGLGGVALWSIDSDDFRGVCRANVTEAFIDLEERAKTLAEDPLLQKALSYLSFPETSLENSGFVVSDDQLVLRLVEARPYNYTLMRTINEATRLALQEKAIHDAMASRGDSAVIGSCFNLAIVTLVVAVIGF